MTNQTPKLGILDDDPRLVELVKKYLTSQGFPDVTALSLAEAISPGGPPVDLLILDIMMPGMDGFEVIRRIRQQSTIGVIFLSAKSEVFDRVVGLELGADDFLIKPFEPRELLARIQAVLRRRTIPPAAKGVGSPQEDQSSAQFPATAVEARVSRLGRLEFQEFVFDQDRQCIIRNDQEFSLTSYEFQLLRLFCANQNIILSRGQITNWLEANNFGSYDRSIDTGISRLRKKIEPTRGTPTVMRTIWGRGYQLVVSRVQEKKT
jgi:two-component system phosphate regulon response regulator OmpR